VTSGNVAFDERVAAHYEAWYETSEGRRADELEKVVLGWLLQSFSGSGSVLELGCGTGHFTRWLSDEGLAAVGLDLSAAMLAEAQALGGVPLVRGDARWLPFADGAFDLTAFSTTLEFLERPREGHIVWRTTLFPRWWPWSQASPPWGGFIGMALIVSDGSREVG